MCVGHEANIATLQELAQELRMETEKIMGERARIKDVVSNKGESFGSLLKYGSIKFRIEFK